MGNIRCKMGRSAGGMRMRLLVRTAAAALVAGTATFAVAPAAHAQTAEFNIQAGKLGDALMQLSRQANVDISAPSNVTAGKRSPAVTGSMSVEAALDHLLAGSGLAAHRIRDRSFVVEPVGNGSAAAKAATSLGEETHGAAAVQNESAAEQSIVVTGTHIRGVTELPSPQLTISRRDIERAGFDSTEKIFERLPQNFAGFAPATILSEGQSGLAGQNFLKSEAIDLRGLGPQATLTLINGGRRPGSVGGRVVDLSTIPVSVIDRVEVVTGGRSSVYGADAVAGVVNVVTRRSFKGLESQVWFGTPTGFDSGQRFQFTQTAGIEEDRGGFVVAYDYSHEEALDLVKTGLFNRFPPNGETLRLDLSPRSNRHSVFASGSVDVSDSVKLFADANYSNRDYHERQLTLQAGATEESFDRGDANSEILSGEVGAEVEISSWKATFTAGAGRSDNRAKHVGFLDFGSFNFPYDVDQREKSSLGHLTAIAEGPVFELGGLQSRLAVGAEALFEGIEQSGSFVTSIDDDRTVRSIFGEAYIPLPLPARLGKRFELTLAGRYDHYSDFGSAFSPQGAVMWAPVEGLTLTGVYSKAFRAPALVEKGAANDLVLQKVPDPSSPGGQTPVLFWLGGRESLRPEKANTWTTTIRFQPAQVPGLDLALSYYDIAFHNRIEIPAQFVDRGSVLISADRFPGLIVRSPDPTEIAAILATDSNGIVANSTGQPWDQSTQSIFDVFPGFVLFDNRTNNIAIERVNGIDATANVSFEQGAVHYTLTANAAWTLNHKRSVTAESPEFSILNGIGRPADFRARLTAGAERGAFSLLTAVNYTSGYPDEISTPPRQMGSWTTVDLSLQYNAPLTSGTPAIRGLGVGITVENIFNTRPPTYLNGNFYGIRFDPANANPLRRYLSVRVRKRW